MALDIATLTTVHTAISFVAIGTGVIAVAALFRARPSPVWTMLFLVTAVATSATGFAFPFHSVLPSHVVGGIALVVLAVLLAARYLFHLSGAWRRVHAVSMVASLYFLVFVGIAQAFAKIPVLRATAPTQSELPFAASQGIVLLGFAVLAFLAARATRPAPMPG